MAKGCLWHFVSFVSQTWVSDRVIQGQFPFVQPNKRTRKKTPTSGQPEARTPKFPCGGLGRCAVSTSAMPFWLLDSSMCQKLEGGLQGLNIEPKVSKLNDSFQLMTVHHFKPYSFTVYTIRMVRDISCNASRLCPSRFACTNYKHNQHSQVARFTLKPVVIAVAVS